ncbi:MAG: FAD-dependent oxidoreductase, partial [Oscillospiraceae bacterium]|nr:FAD-dependent oxidoreductase [Oscillospiraceae bacterium]
NGLLLLGGGGHRTGKQGGCYAELESFKKKHYPASAEVTRWATQDCITLDGAAYIGQYSKSTPNLYVATGFNKWGVTSSMVAADILCDLILGKENEFSSLFSPSRSILRPQLVLNAAESVVNLLTFTGPRCPHLGCSLKWNKHEHSWDCPCHGSRFSEDGKLLNGPATDDIKL